MKSRASTPRRRQPARLAAGAATTRPAPGWKGPATATLFVNARPPSVPASLALTLEEYFTAGALLGLLASQHDEPDKDWACDWSFRMGQQMAAEALKRRRQGQRNGRRQKQRTG